MVKRGEIWLINLDPTLGSEIRKPRPCVVVLPAEMNEHLRTVIVVPMASRGGDAPFRPTLTFQGTAGRLLLDQIPTVDKARLVKRLGNLTAHTRQKVMGVLQELFVA